MKKRTFLQKHENFYKDPKKKYIKKFRIYPSFMYARLDRWLKKMSLSGWHIVHCGMLFFVFEKGEPANKEYFTYLHLINEKNHNLALMFPFLEETYGVKAKKSKINANKSKFHQIVEIDTQKIDTEKDVGYLELISERNKMKGLLLLWSLIASLGLLIIVIYLLSIL